MNGTTMAASSRDGTRIAYDRTGEGPVVVLVDGAMCHRALGPAPKLVPLLAERFTVVSYDRRGRGDSGSHLEYAVQKEIDDLAAVLATVDSPASVLGMSSGAALAVRAAAAGLPIARLALFEPPYVGHAAPEEQPPADALQAVQSLVDAGRNAEAITYFLTRVIGMPAAAVTMLKLFRGLWGRTTATAPTLPHELRIMGDWLAPTGVLGLLSMPTHVIVGDRSPSKLQAAHEAVLAANPAVTAVRLHRQGHNVSMKVLGAAVEPILTSSHTS